MKSTGADVQVRGVVESDAASIVQFLNPIIDAGCYTIIDSPLSIEEQAEFIRRFPGRGIFNVAVTGDDQRILGLQSVEPASNDLNALRHVGEIATFVSLDSQRCGVGRALAQQTMRQANSQGFRKIIAMIRADNQRAIAFYESQGFQLIGTARKHARVRDEYIDEVFLERLLDDA